jgi:hypothetical protein
VIETGLDEEITGHLGYEKHDPAGQGQGSGNVRNGSRPKTVLTDSTGQVEIDVPRDRAGTFNEIVPGWPAAAPSVEWEMLRAQAARSACRPAADAGGRMSAGGSDSRRFGDGMRRACLAAGLIPRGCPTAVPGAMKGSQRVQAPSDSRRHSRTVRAGGRLPVRLHPTQADAGIPHGMQEVWGSNPIAPPGQARNSNDKAISGRLTGGIPRGKIRPWDSWLISIRAESGQVGRTTGAFVACKRSGVPGRGCAGEFLLLGAPRAQMAPASRSMAAPSRDAGYGACT